MQTSAVSPKSSPVLTLLAHVDATPHDLEPFEVAEVDSFERAHRADTQVRVELSRQSSPALVNLGLGLLQAAALPLAWSFASQLGPLAFPIQIAASYMTFNGASRIVNGLRNLTSKEKAWSGTRVYDIAPDQVKGRLDSPVVSQMKTKRPTVSQLSQFLADGMKAYPAQVTAFMASGHGLAYQSCSSYTVNELKKAMDDAATQAGRKVDVVILEACLMGNLESLQTIKDSARYAIVSEETMGAAGLPWDNIMKSLPQGSMTAEQFGRRVVEQSIGARGIDTLALVDLQKVQPLSQAVEGLATELRRVVASGGRAEVRAALKDAQSYPMGMDPLSRMSFNVRDLGGVSDAVAARIGDARVQLAAANVRNALRDAIVSSTESGRYSDASHVSIQSSQPFFKTEHYAQETGFTEWGSLLKDLKRVG